MKRFARFLDVVAGLAWLVLLSAINVITGEPTRFIVPYAAPVVVVTWRRHVRWGFTLAGAGAFSAVASGAVQGNANAGVSIAAEGLLSFAQLSAIAIGIAMAKRRRG